MMETEMMNMTAENGNGTMGIREMDALFRSVDFAAENAGLAERLMAKIRARIAAQESDWLSGGLELSEDALSGIAAAGASEAGSAEIFRRVCCQGERGHP